MATCYDLRFPEQFRRMVSRSAEMFLVCAAWPKARAEDWELLCRARALENQSFLLACNTCGTCGGAEGGEQGVGGLFAIGGLASAANNVLDYV